MSARPAWCSPTSASAPALPAYARTTVRLNPARAGTFGFACGMNMVHGTLLVDPATASDTTRRAAGEDRQSCAAAPTAAGLGRGRRRRRRRPSGGRRSPT